MASTMKRTMMNYLELPEWPLSAPPKSVEVDRDDLLLDAILADIENLDPGDTDGVRRVVRNYLYPDLPLRDAELVSILNAWARRINSAPVGELVDADTAVAMIESAHRRRARLVLSHRMFVTIVFVLACIAVSSALAVVLAIVWGA